MKGTLTKKINGTWVVRVQSTDQHESHSVIEHGQEFPLHPDDVKTYDWLYQSYTQEEYNRSPTEVEFEIVHLSTDPLGRDVKPYAKLVDKLGNEDVSKLGYDVEKLADQSWEGCDGCTEAEEAMYKNGYVHGYNAAKGGELETFKDQFADVRKMVEDDVEKLALEEAKKLHCIGKHELYNELVIKDAELIKLGIKVAKSTLYTEEQVQKMIDDALTNYELGWADRRKQQNLYTEKEVRKAIYGNPKFIFGKDQAEAIIQSLKQPKQN